jgi:hypothetical protein
MNNLLAFHPSGKLLLFQIESRDGKELPDPVNFRNNPPVGRVRDLLAKDPTKALFEITEFPSGIEFPAAPTDGRFFGMIGYYGPSGETARINVYDGVTGKEIWASEPETRMHGGDRPLIVFDPKGRYLMIGRYGKSSGQTTSVEMPSGKLLRQAEYGPVWRAAWSLDMPYRTEARSGALGLFRPEDKDPVLLFGIDTPTMGQRFFATGTRYAWGNADGTVHVADIPEVQRRLARIGLGW